MRRSFLFICSGFQLHEFDLTEFDRTLFDLLGLLQMQYVFSRFLSSFAVFSRACERHGRDERDSRPASSLKVRGLLVSFAKELTHWEHSTPFPFRFLSSNAATTAVPEHTLLRLIDINPLCIFFARPVSKEQRTKADKTRHQCCKETILFLAYAEC